MKVYEFGPFRLEPAERRLRRDGTSLPLTPKAFDTLLVLVGNPGRAVGKEELLATVWPGTNVAEATLAQNIFALRKALGGEACIETVPKFGYRFVPPVREVAAPARKNILAVLPFDNLSGDPEQEYFSDGLTEEMISQLGRLNPQGLGVIARTSSMRYRHTEKTVEAIGRELGASLVLEGSVRHAAGRVRVTAQLVQVSDQTQLWSDSFERALGDILSLQNDLAHAIAAQIGVRLGPEERRRLASPKPVDPAAYHAYLKGRYWWKRRSREALEQSVRAFHEAIEIDPDYAPAYAGLADVHLTQMDYNYLAPRDAFALVDRALLDALRLDNALAEPHTSLGHLRLHQFNWAAAARQFTRAIELNPGYDTAHYYYANLLAALGRFDEALAEADRAVELDPVSSNTRQNRLFVLYLARRYEGAVESVKETIAMDPAHTGLYYYLGQVYERQGKYAEAIDAFRQVSQSSNSRGATVLAAIGHAHARAGEREAALDVLAQLEALPAHEYVSWYDLALLHLALGNRDLALANLSKAHDEYSSFLPFLNIDARLDALRGDPRFHALVRRMNFPVTPGTAART